MEAKPLKAEIPEYTLPGVTPDDYITLRCTCTYWKFSGGASKSTTFSTVVGLHKG